MEQVHIFLRFMLEFAMLLPGMACCFLPAKNSFRFPARRVIGCASLAAAAGMLIGPALCMLTGCDTNVILLPMMVPMLILFRCVTSLSWGRLLFVFFNGMMLSALPTLLCMYFFAERELTQTVWPFYYQTGIICLLLSALVILLFRRMLSEKFPALFEMRRFEKLWRWFFLIPLAVTLLLLFLRPLDYANVLVGRIQIISVLLWFLLVAVIYCFYQFFWYIGVQIGRKEELQQENILLHTEEQRYQTLQEHVRSTRALRHDFRQHLRVLTGLAGEDDLEGLKRYLSEYVGSIGTEHEAYCNNPVADAVAAYYQHGAEQQGTVIQWSLLLPEKLPVSDTDYCSILGNLLENALKATEKLPKAERIIRVNSRMIGPAMMGLCVSNRCEDGILIGEDGFPVKKRGERHGIGLASVSSAVTRSGGSLAIEAEDGWFTVNVLFNLS